MWTIPVPWAGARSRFTALFEQMAVTVLLAARTLTQAAQWLQGKTRRVPLRCLIPS